MPFREAGSAERLRQLTAIAHLSMLGGMPSLPGAFGSADPLILLLLAMGLEGYLGGAWLTGLLTAPRARLVRAARELQRRLDRAERGRGARIVRGWIVTLILLLPAFMTGLALEFVTRNLPYAVLLELPLVAALVRQRGPWQAAALVRDGLAAGSHQLAEQALLRLDPDPAALTSLENRAIDALGARFADGAVGPVFGYLLLGLPGLLTIATLRLLARLYGPDGPFGRAALLLDRLLLWPARRFAAVLLALATLFQPQGQSGRAMLLALSGAAPGDVLRSGLGAAFAELNRALWLYGMACLLHLGTVAALLLLRLSLVAVD